MHYLTPYHTRIGVVKSLYSLIKKLDVNPGNPFSTSNACKIKRSVNLFPLITPVSTPGVLTHCRVTAVIYDRLDVVKFLPVLSVPPPSHRIVSVAPGSPTSDLISQRLGGPLR